MGKISTYTVLSTPTLNDKLIGTDVTTNNETKNFLVGDLLALGVSGGNIGKLLGGGIVAAEWNESGVTKLLIASLTNLTSVQWTLPAFQSTVIGSTAQSSSNGLINTNAIISQTGASAANTYAAGAARLHNGGAFSDWYLPSIWEINLCFGSAAIINKVLGDVNGFLQASYWSSTEFSAANGNLLVSQTGGLSNTTKSTAAQVRAVRIHNI